MASTQVAHANGHTNSKWAPAMSQVKVGMRVRLAAELHIVYAVHHQQLFHVCAYLMHDCPPFRVPCFPQSVALSNASPATPCKRCWAW